MVESKRAFAQWALENTDTSFSNLEEFAKKNKLLQSVALYLASKGEGEDHSVRAIFDMFDENSNGSVSFLELVEGRTIINISNQIDW